MLVHELIAELECLEGDAEIRIMSQPSWPFEYSVSGIVTSQAIEDHAREVRREDYDEDEEGESVEGVPLEDRHPSTGINEKPKCVFIVEGSQLSYGDKLAWELT